MGSDCRTRKLRGLAVFPGHRPAVKASVKPRLLQATVYWLTTGIYISGLDKQSKTAVSPKIDTCGVGLQSGCPEMLPVEYAFALSTWLSGGEAPVFLVGDRASPFKSESARTGSAVVFIRFDRIHTVPIIEIQLDIYAIEGAEVALYLNLTGGLGRSLKNTSYDLKA